MRVKGRDGEQYEIEPEADLSGAYLDSADLSGAN